MDREKLILEMFELSRDIGFRHFLKQNFHRDDPALTRLNPEERKAFLRQWWDGARDRMLQEYRQQVAGLSIWDLLDRRQDYVEALDAIGMLELREQKGIEDLRKQANELKAEAKKERPNEPERATDNDRGR